MSDPVEVSPGKISQVDLRAPMNIEQFPCAYTIAYDDGHTESKVPPSAIEALASNTDAEGSIDVKSWI